MAGGSQQVISDTPRIPVIMPDFVIIGAAKCGTTALYRYLSTHPNLAMSTRKEPYYWCPDVPVRAPLIDPADYATLWNGASPGARKGEATPAYIRSAVALPAILDAGPSTRFILILRNPAEMAASFHAQMLVDLEEDVTDFERAWRLQEHRRQGRCLPNTCFHPPNLQYAEVCALGDQLERFVAAVPEAQRLVLLQDDLAQDPRGVYLRMLEFLGVEDDGRSAFEPVNRNRRRSGTRVMRIQRRLSRSLGPLYAPLRAIAHGLGISPSQLIGRLPIREAPRPPLDSRFEQELRTVFAPQIKKIETLIGRDLSHWRERAR